VWRVAVDAGFSCPHRTGGRSGPGCTFCPGDGGRASYITDDDLPRFLADADAVRRQVARAVAVLGRRGPAAAWVLFYQAYTGTNAPAAELARLWEAGLHLAPFRELSVATRPDCLDAEKAALLASLGDHGRRVWVERGLQSAREETLRLVRRGHSTDQFAEGVRIAKSKGLLVAAHVILGLPAEGIAEARATARFLAGLGVDGVKIHDLHVVRGTALAREMLAGEVPCATAAGHLERVVAFLEELPAHVVVMRLTCDTPAFRLLAPRRSIDKSAFSRALAREMLRRGTAQGRRCPLASLQPTEPQRRP
jgi:radical SAM protein (TIGR01212 family)